MLVGELLYRIEERGVSLRCRRSEDRLHYSPPGALPPELVAELRTHKQEIIRILREDEAFQRTGLIQTERQVFDLAQEYFGKAGQCNEPWRDDGEGRAARDKEAY